MNSTLQQGNVSRPRSQSGTTIGNTMETTSGGPSGYPTENLATENQDHTPTGIVLEQTREDTPLRTPPTNQHEITPTGIILESNGITNSGSIDTSPSETQPENEHAGINQRNRKRNRKRNVIWFNPPFCKSVETKVGQVFFDLIQKHFPNNHRYHKIFNRNTIKVSYSCMDNMECIIKQHNIKILQAGPIEAPRCDCRNPESCPLDGLCNSTNVNYSATVEHTDRRGRDTSRTYIGVTEPAFKKRFTVHTHTFNNRGTPNDTCLSKYVWKLKDEGITDFSIRWSILKKAAGYSKSSKKCGLCLAEKLLICEYPDKEQLLNDRSELVSKCRHFNKHLLSDCRQI